MNKRSKKTIQMALKVFVRLLLAGVLCAILYVSMNVISTGLLSNVVGYQIFEQTENQETIMVEEHFYQPGETVVEAKDLELKDNQIFSAIREVPDTAKGIMKTLSQVMMLILVCVFPYHILWEFGHRDDTNVRYHGQRPDPFRGAKIGLLAMLPYAICTLLMIVSKYVAALSGMLSIYRFIAFPYLPYFNWLVGEATTAADVSLIRLLLMLPMLLIVPVVCGIAYRLGGQSFSIAEFITFQKKKDGESTDEI